MPGAARRGLPRRARELEPGDDHDRPRVRRRHLRRAARRRRRLTRIIERERPDALLPTLGGQTALNLAIELHEAGVLDAYGVELIGASVEAIRTAEDRHAFKAAMSEIGLAVPPLGLRVHASTRRCAVARAGRLPAHRAARRSSSAAAAPASRTTPTSCARVADARPRREPGLGDPHRAVGRGLEGVRARGHARPRRQRRRHLLDRELRPDGRAHRRLDHRRARADAHRRRVPAHARRRVRVHPPHRRRHRRLEHPVRGRTRERRHGRHRDEPARVAQRARSRARPPGSRSPRSRPGSRSATGSTRS